MVRLLRRRARVASGTATTKGLKGLVQMGSEKGVSFVPENETVVHAPVVKVRPKGAVRDGAWK